MGRVISWQMKHPPQLFSDRRPTDRTNERVSGGGSPSCARTHNHIGRHSRAETSITNTTANVQTKG